MRREHFICGLMIFSIGLFLIYRWNIIVIEFLKGIMQPLILILGLTILSSVILNRTSCKKINFFLGLLSLAVGSYGLYDEYIAVKDFFIGCIPIILTISGLIMVIYGIRHLTNSTEVGQELE